MKIAVLGTGVVGKHLAAKLSRLGHQVRMGTRDPGATMTRSGSADTDDPPFSQWSLAHPEVALASFADAAAYGEVVWNATRGMDSLLALGLAGAENLAGKVLIDTARPLDTSEGFPPTLFVKDTDSLGELIQRAFPEARVVKTLDTLYAHVMVNPVVLGEESTVFVSGNDADAKAMVTDLLTDFGHTDVIDLGDISAARGTEMMLPMWLRLMDALGTTAFNFKIVR